MVLALESMILDGGAATDYHIFVSPHSRLLTTSTLALLSFQDVEIFIFYFILFIYFILF